MAFRAFLALLMGFAVTLDIFSAVVDGCHYNHKHMWIGIIMAAIAAAQLFDIYVSKNLILTAFVCGIVLLCGVAIISMSLYFNHINYHDRH